MMKGSSEEWLIKDHFMHDAASLCKGEASQNIQLIDVSSMAVRTTFYFEHLTFC